MIQDAGSPEAKKSSFMRSFATNRRHSKQQLTAYDRGENKKPARPSLSPRAEPRRKKKKKKAPLHGEYIPSHLSSSRASPKRPRNRFVGFVGWFFGRARLRCACKVLRAGRLGFCSTVPQAERHQGEASQHVSRASFSAQLKFEAVREKDIQYVTSLFIHI